MIPSGRLIAHKWYLTGVFWSMAFVNYGYGKKPLSVIMLFVGLGFLHDLGFVTLKQGKLVRWRITGRKKMVTPNVIAVEIDMMSRRVVSYYSLHYFYPVLTLANGKAIRLPLGSSKRRRTEQQVARIRQALNVPEVGSFETPKHGAIGRFFTGGQPPPAVAALSVPETNPYGEFTPLPGLESPTR